MDRQHILRASQALIAEFTEQMAKLETQHGVYVKIHYGDLKPRPVHIYGEPVKPFGYIREMEIEDITLAWGGYDGIAPELLEREKKNTGV